MFAHNQQFTNSSEKSTKEQQNSEGENTFFHPLGPLCGLNYLFLKYLKYYISRVNLTGAHLN